jgi:diguanylate cyclase (GGDEF)-like protein
MASNQENHEIIYLKKLVKAYEKISQMTGVELQEAQKTIQAYESVNKLARDELIHIASSIESVRGRQNSITEEIVRILDEDMSIDTDVFNKFNELSKSSPENFYSDLFHVLTNLELTEEEAKELWTEVCNHNKELNEKLNRKINLRVALLDYILERNRVIKNPKIIELHFFDSVLKNSVVDELTNINNRRYFNLAFRRELKRGKRYSRKISLFVFDLDNFKKLNDTYGHATGDLVLQTVGQVLKDSFRIEDTLCRVGGEEFCVILPEIEAESALVPCKRFAEKLKEKSKEKIGIEVTISGGICEYPTNGDTLEELYAKADTALYKVKNSGKNNISTFKD